MAQQKRNSIVVMTLEALTEEYQEMGWRAFTPWWLLIFIAAGGVLWICLPDLPADLDGLLTLIVGLLTAQGIILAMTISAGQQILAAVSGPGFSSYLRRKGILKHYLVNVAIMQGVGLISILVLLATAGVIVWGAREAIIRPALGASLTSFLYSVRWISGGSLMVRDLIWYRSIFEEVGPPQKNGDVVPLNGRDTASR